MKRVRLFLFALLMLLSLTGTAFAEAPTVEENYFSEYTYAYGVEALDSISDEQTRSNLKSILNENNLSIISVNTATAYFIREGVGDGSYTYRPMTVDEVAAYTDSTISQTATNSIINPSDESRGKLTISLTVSADARRQLWALASATWEEREIIGNPDEQQAKYDDRCAISWGGDGALKATQRSISGTYYNGMSIPFTENTSNKSKGYSWSFEELSKGGTGGLVPNLPAKRIGASVTLATGSATLQGKTTTCTFEYVHTFAKANGGGSDDWSLSVTARELPY